MEEPRNPEYQKVKELIEIYFDRIKYKKPTEEILFELKNYSFPLNQALLLIEKKYKKIIVNELEENCEKSLREIENENTEIKEELEKSQRKINKIEKLVKNNPWSKIIELINNPQE